MKQPTLAARMAARQCIGGELPLYCYTFVIDPSRNNQGVRAAQGSVPELVP
jgi:hypothetical protein